MSNNVAYLIGTCIVASVLSAVTVAQQRKQKKREEELMAITKETIDGCFDDIRREAEEKLNRTEEP